MFGKEAGTITTEGITFSGLFSFWFYTVNKLTVPVEEVLVLGPVFPPVSKTDEEIQPLMDPADSCPVPATS